MEYLQIPYPDFDLSEHVRLEADIYIKRYLSQKEIENYTIYHKSDIPDTKRLIESKVYDYSEQFHQAVFITHLLNHLFTINAVEVLKRTPINNIVPNAAVNVNRNIQYYELIREYQFFLYNLSSKIGISLEKNTFDTNEAFELSNKLDNVINVLDQLLISEQSHSAQIASFKEDLNTLAKDFVSGKKSWYQRYTGIVFNFTLTKLSDEGWTALWPHLKALFVHAPQIAQVVQTFLEQSLK